MVLTKNHVFRFRYSFSHSTSNIQGWSKPYVKCIKWGLYQGISNLRTLVKLLDSLLLCSGSRLFLMKLALNSVGIDARLFEVYTAVWSWNERCVILDLKLHLQSTDYGNFLANEASPLAVATIDDKLKEKLVVEFQHMRNHALPPLSTFLDYITYVQHK